MIFKTIEPNEILKPYVHSIQLTDMNNGERLYNQKIVPYGMAGLIINYRGECSITTNAEGKKILPEIFIAGLTNQPVVLDGKGAIGTIAVNLYPTGLYHLLHSGASELLNTTVNLSNVIGPQADHLYEMIINTEDDEKKINYVEQFLIHRFSSVCDRDTIFTNAAEKLIHENAGRLAVSQLSELTGTSISSLERNFQRQTGLTPKTYSQILRFNQVFKLLRESKSEYWHDVIYLCGYYDQAHFIKEFVRFAGETPRKFFLQKYRASEFYSGK